VTEFLGSDGFVCETVQDGESGLTKVANESYALVELTVVEFELLALLLQSAGRVITREELVKSVLGRQFNSLDQSIDMRVSNRRSVPSLSQPLRSRPDADLRHSCRSPLRRCITQFCKSFLIRCARIHNAFMVIPI